MKRPLKPESSRNFFPTVRVRSRVTTIFHNIHILAQKQPQLFAVIGLFALIGMIALGIILSGFQGGFHLEVALDHFTIDISRMISR